MVTGLSPFWNTIANMRHSFVAILATLLVYLALKRTYTNKYKKISLAGLLIGSYGLFFLTTMIIFIVIERL